MLVAGDGTGLGHAGEAEIGGIRQHRGEHHPAVIRRQIGPEMGEAVAEPGPACDLIEKVGNADPRQQSVKPGGQRLGCFRCDRLKRRDLERRAADPDILQLVLASLVGNPAQPLVKKLPPSSKPGGGVERHRDGKRSGLFHGGEQRLRDKLVLNRPVVPTSRDPDVAGTEPIAQLGEQAEFINPAVDLPVLHDRGPPTPANEAGREVRQCAPVTGVEGSEQLHRLHKAVGGRHSLKREGLEEQGPTRRRRAWFLSAKAR